MKKREQLFLGDFSRAIKKTYPEWDYFKIPDGGSRFSVEKPCDSILHFSKGDMVYYFPLEAKSVKGASRFDLSRIETHQWTYLEKYSMCKNRNATGYFLIHYDVPRNSFFNIYTVDEMLEIKSRMKSIPYVDALERKDKFEKYSEIDEKGKRKVYYEISKLKDVLI